MSVEGVDYAWSRPDIGQLAALGYKFACRYGGPGTSGKQLDPAEAVNLSQAGIAVVANAEGAADGMLGGWNAGVDWARRAEAHFAKCGMPTGRPIYLSVDFAVTRSQWDDSVRNALRGAASVLGARRVGIYGGIDPIVWARQDNVAQWFWQTYAWSGGQWAPGNHIEQYRNGVVVAGATLDLNRAHPADYGQWTTGVDDDMDQREKWIVANAYQVLYEQTHEHDPINWITDLDTGKTIQLPNIPLRRAKRIEAKVDHLTELIEAIGTSNPDVAAIVAALKAEFADQLVKIETVVDTELDEQSRAGADND